MMTSETSSLRCDLAVEQLNAGGKFYPAQPGLEWVWRQEKNGDCRRAGSAAAEVWSVSAQGIKVIFYHLALHCISLYSNCFRYYVPFHCGLHWFSAWNLNGSPALRLRCEHGGEGVRAAGWPIPYNTFGRGKIIHVARWWAELRCCRFRSQKKKGAAMPMGDSPRKKEGRGAAWKLSA